MSVPRFECALVATYVWNDDDGGMDVKTETTKQVVGSSLAAVLEQLGTALQQETPLAARQATEGYTTVAFGVIREILILGEVTPTDADIRATATWQAHAAEMVVADNLRVAESMRRADAAAVRQAESEKAELARLLAKYTTGA